MNKRYGRLIAAFVDITVMIIPGGICGAIVFAIYNQKIVGDIFARMEVLFNIWIIFMLFSLFVYYAITDIEFHGISIGKKLTGIRIMSNTKVINKRFALMHATAKLVALLIWPITLVYYVCTKNMFYDKVLKIEIFKLNR